jgi:polar amino acid transport system substrate-binding protein
MRYLALIGVVLGLTTATAVAAGPACTRPLSLALHDHGLLYSSATDSGIDKDIAVEMARRSGCKITLTVLPRARIWQLIETGALDFSLSGISNPERLKFANFAWYFADRYYLLVRKDAGVTKLADFQSADGLQLGAIRSFRYGPQANDFADALHAAGRVSYSTGLEPLYEVLLLNRIQGMIIEPFDYPALQQKHIQDMTLSLAFDDPAIPHGLILSRKSLSATEQAQWQALIAAMHADGTVLRIFEKYFPHDMAAAMVNF